MVLPKKNFDRRFEEDHLFLLTFARLEISGGRRAVISVVTGNARVDIRDVFPNTPTALYLYIIGLASSPWLFFSVVDRKV
jgi:hypothetical protein